ncbi:hypothetical protein [Clostridium sp.]|uniref:hypothetical protein n=1 Tax=Clostridium sp. TaxID=1506 RepID=UPI002601630E|nr:hypothetical protein [Clostridium sp.]
MRTMFYNVLPTYKEGANKGNINWIETIGLNVNFDYNGFKDSIQIVDYNLNTNKLTVQYKNNSLEIGIGNFRKCNIGKVINKINMDFVYNVNNIINKDNRNLKILEKFKKKTKKGYDERWYKYECLNCGNIDNINESDLSNGIGCNVCCTSPRKILIGYNDIATTATEMIKYLTNKDDAYKYSCNSGKKISFTCPKCGDKKKKVIQKVHIRGFFCDKCGDSKSYPEKIVFNILEQLQLKFEIQKKFIWSKNKIYDFYFKINNEQYIIETHGMQHYKETKIGRGKGRTLEEEQENDKSKKNLALANGIKEENYIIIDCRYSTLEWIRDNDCGILNSKLNELFDLSKIDWLKCHEFACNSLVKTVCNLWNSGIKNTLEISKIIKLHRGTITRYLKGTELGWCDYDAKIVTSLAHSKARKFKGKKIRCVETGDIFNNCFECEVKSLDVFGVKLLKGNIYLNCTGKRSHYKNLHFEYVDKNN